MCRRIDRDRQIHRPIEIDRWIVDCTDRWIEGNRKENDNKYKEKSNTEKNRERKGKWKEKENQIKTEKEIKIEEEK